MSERQILIQWLSQVARRLRLIRCAQTLATTTLCLLALVLLHQLLRATVSQREVLQALLPLFILMGTGVLCYAGLRLARDASLGEAAAAADHAGHLSDQIKSAYWFAGSPMDQPVVEVLMHRACGTVAQLDPKHLLPLRMPRLAWGSVVMAALVGTLTVWSPRAAHSVKDGDGASWAVAARADKVARAGAANSSGTDASGEAARGGQGVRNANSIPDSARRRDSDDPDTDAAAGAEDRGPADSLISASASEPPPAGNSDARRSAQNKAAESPSEWLGSVVARLKEMMEQNDGRLTGEGSAAEGDGLDGARMGPADNGRRDDGGARNPTPEYRDADRSGMNDIRMNALGGLGPRNTIAGEGSGEEQSGRNNSNSGALGQRVGTSRAGAGDESEAPRGNPGGETESTPVLGKKTQRLAMQLKQVAAQSKNSAPVQNNDEGTPEAFFSATRSQAARVQTQDVQASVRASRSESIQAEQTPLAYRTVVKDYFLTQHRKEK